MKYRTKLNKIKQEHSIIKGLKDFLSVLHVDDEISAMIPGEIKPVKKAVPEITLRRIVPTRTGVKGLFQAGAAVQEVFFVGDADYLLNLLSEFLPKKKDNK